ncbi:CoA transferase, partial [Thermodesulfobacteriota bacterium]
DPHNKARDMVIEVTDPFTGDPVKQVGFVLKFSVNPASLRFGPNLMGAETFDIMRELGYDKRSIQRLKETKVIAIPK